MCMGNECMVIDKQKINSFQNIDNFKTKRHNAGTINYIDLDGKF